MKAIEAKIFCGLREAYTDIRHSSQEAFDVCRDYVNRVGLCVTLTETEFVYTDGWEHGVIIGLINYPRFKPSKRSIKKHTENIVSILQLEFKQIRISYIIDNKIYMSEHK